MVQEYNITVEYMAFIVALIVDRFINCRPSHLVQTFFSDFRPGLDQVFRVFPNFFESCFNFLKGVHLSHKCCGKYYCNGEVVTL